MSDLSSQPAAIFHQLVSVLSDELDRINHAGATAFGRGDYADVEAMRTQAQALNQMRADVAALAQRWQALRPAAPPPVDPPTTLRLRVTPDVAPDAAPDEPQRRKRSHVRSGGQRTPEAAFRIPILQALVEMGGRGKIAVVLDHVELKLRDVLTEHDYSMLESTPGLARWYNSAQWERNRMYKEGLLLKPRHGIWQISDAGRVWLAEHA